MEKTVKLFNSQLDKASDFRYFALLGTFLLFFESAMVLTYQIPLKELEYKVFLNEVSLGEILVFFLVFALFLSFIVKVIQEVLRIMVNAFVPYSWLKLFHYDKFTNVSPKDYYYDYQIAEYALKSNNSVAYQHYQNLLSAKDSFKQLERVCFALILSFLFNMYCSTISDSVMTSEVLALFDDNKITFCRALLTILFTGVFIYCVYFGIIRGCDLSIDSQDKHYFEDNKFRS